MVHRSRAHCVFAGRRKAVDREGAGRRGTDGETRHDRRSAGRTRVMPWWNHGDSGRRDRERHRAARRRDLGARRQLARLLRIGSSRQGGGVLGAARSAQQLPRPRARPRSGSSWRERMHGRLFERNSRLSAGGLSRDGLEAEELLGRSAVKTAGKALVISAGALRSPHSGITSWRSPANAASQNIPDREALWRGRVPQQNVRPRGAERTVGQGQSGVRRVQRQVMQRRASR